MPVWIGFWTQAPDMAQVLQHGLGPLVNLGAITWVAINSVRLYKELRNGHGKSAISAHTAEDIAGRIVAILEPKLQRFREDVVDDVSNVINNQALTEENRRLRDKLRALEDNR